MKDGNIFGRDENKRNELSYLNQVTNYMLRDESSSYGSSGPQKLQRQTAFNSLEWHGWMYMGFGCNESHG